MVCPLCGKKSEVGMFCSECYLKKNLKLELPGRIKLEVCPKCRTYFLDNKWVEGISEYDAVVKITENKLESNIKGIDKSGSLKIEADEQDKKYNVTVRFALSDSEIVKKTEVLIRNSPCSDCSRMAGGYFEAVLQMRGGISKKKVEEIADEIEKHKDSHSFVSDVKRVQGGYDLYLGSKKSAEKIVRKYRGVAEIKKSHRQAGIDKQSSKSKYRFYYLIRL
jgi:nonsense-mediated mRNA decay protein 3